MEDCMKIYITEQIQESQRVMSAMLADGALLARVESAAEGSPAYHRANHEAKDRSARHEFAEQRLWRYASLVATRQFDFDVRAIVDSHLATATFVRVIVA